MEEKTKQKKSTGKQRRPEAAGGHVSRVNARTKIQYFVIYYTYTHDIPIFVCVY